MGMENQILIVMYILLGCVAAMLYALRRIFLLESKILRLEKLILNFDRKLGAKLFAKKPVAKPVAKKAKKKKKR